MIRQQHRVWLAAAVFACTTGIASAAIEQQAKQEPQPVEKPAAEAAKPAWYTLIADYSANRIVEIDDRGQESFAMESVFGAWDVEPLPGGDLLITEFSVSRVSIVGRDGKRKWTYEKLKNPYDADLLPNGNVLIANTFAGSVIEVQPNIKRGLTGVRGFGGEVVWSYDRDIRPFDADRLPNGNTLITDVAKDRILEVNPEGKIVWEAKNQANCHDADRLMNGNTLITLRTKNLVREIDKDGKLVWELRGLSAPSDADRLDNGNTLVAENARVREYDADGKVIWETETTWAVEAARYTR